MTTLPPRVPPAPRPSMRTALACLLLASACVTTNATTGEVIPRKGQRYPFERIERDAANLRTGMTKSQVFMLLGTPAEKDAAGDVWVYLPERYGVIVPARALRVEFRDGLLAEHGFRAIVLGQTL